MSDKDFAIFNKLLGRTEKPEFEKVVRYNISNWLLTSMRGKINEGKDQVFIFVSVSQLL